MQDRKIAIELIAKCLVRYYKFQCYVIVSLMSIELIIS